MDSFNLLGFLQLDVDVVTSLGGVVDKALIFYFVHPGRPCCQENRNSLKFRMSVLQVSNIDDVYDKKIVAS